MAIYLPNEALFGSALLQTLPKCISIIPNILLFSVKEKLTTNFDSWKLVCAIFGEPQENAPKNQIPCNLFLWIHLLWAVHG